MQKLSVVATATLFCLALPIFPSERARHLGPSVQAPTSTSRKIELTESDLFATEGWDSTQVQILGFRLGMTRLQANENADRHDLVLLVPDLRNLAKCQTNLCEVCDSHGVCRGITLMFGDEEKVDRIDITRAPEDAAKVVRKAAITGEFKGSTYQFFNRYSDKLREKLLGPGLLVKKQVQSPPKVSLLEESYLYPQRGLEILATLDESSPGSPSDIDLTVSFARPNDSGR